jgi:TetR/AcrR family transcriptional repressor of lmrAB and yxaGH operons
MPRRNDSRVRMIEAAVELFRKQGYHATAFSDVVRESGAPRGSIYFHFPGGKEELAEAAIAAGGDEIVEITELAAAGAADPGGLIRALADFGGERLRASGYRSGCAIATMVLELAPDNERLRAGFEKALSRWQLALGDALAPWGFDDDRASAWAALIMATLEGALILSRAALSLDPLSQAIDPLVEMINAEAGLRPSTGRGKPTRKVRAAGL